MKNYIIIATVSLLVGLGLGYKLVPPRVETKTVVQEKEVIKREIVRKDGTVVKEEIVKDKVKQQNRVVAKLAQNRLNLTYNRQNVFGLEYQYRLTGPLFIGASINNEGVLGISLGFEF